MVNHHRKCKCIEFCLNQYGVLGVEDRLHKELSRAAFPVLARKMVVTGGGADMETALS